MKKLYFIVLCLFLLAGYGETKSQGKYGATKKYLKRVLLSNVEFSILIRQDECNFSISLGVVIKNVGEISLRHWSTVETLSAKLTVYPTLM